MPRALLHRGGEAEDLALAERGIGQHPGHLGPAHRQRPGLVEDRHLHLAQLLQRRAVP